MRSWQFSEMDGRLFSEDRIALLTPKTAAVLKLLLQKAPEPVARSEFLDTVWNGVNVTDDLVREYIHDIRTILQDDAKSPVYIKTIRGYGFQLIGPVEMKRSVETATDAKAVLAVLRPEVFAVGAEWRHYADGFAEDLTTDLARFPEISVVARQSAFAASNTNADVRQIIENLGADYIVESSLACVGDDLKINVQLISGPEGRHVWAERWSRTTREFPKSSEHLAAMIANAIGGWDGQLLAAERERLRRNQTRRLAAYEHYLLTLHYEHSFDDESVRLGIEHGRAAADLDPDFARIWLLLGFLYFREPARAFFDSDEAQHSARIDAINRALRLDPRDPMVLSEAAELAAANGNLSRAADLLARGADLASNQADPAMLLAGSHAYLLGDLETSQSLMNVGFELNPFGPLWYRNVEARISFVKGDYDRSIELFHSHPELESCAVLGLLSCAVSSDDRALRQAMKQFHETRPNYDFEGFKTKLPIVEPRTVTRFDKAVARLAGISV